MVARSVTGKANVRGAVLLPAADGLASELHRLIPGLDLVEAPLDRAERRFTLTAQGPFDFIVDEDEVPNRKRRFGATFYHLRAGGAYVVPGGAPELGATPGPLGRLLQDAAARPEAELRVVDLPLAEARLRAIRSHVRTEAVDGHLVVRHDLPDVHVKMREADFDDYLRRASTRHRLLSVRPGMAPEPPEFVELPEPRPHHEGRPIDAVELSLRDYRDVVVEPYQVVLDGHLILPDTYRHHRNEVLRNKLTVDLARDFAVPVRPVPPDPPRLEGTYFHLDNEARGHFGHLMTESLSRVWAWPEVLALDPDARVLLGANRKRPRPLEYELALYEACGIPRERIVVIDGPVLVDRLITGTPMFSNPQYVHSQIAEIWQQVGDRLAAQVAPRDWPERIFVSRREVKRACLNGADVEAVFAEHDFEIVYPEDYSLGEQVEMFRAAEVIAGFSGSGMFQIAFVAEPKRVIQVGSMAYGPRNEFLMAAIRRHRIDSIVCQSDEGRGIRADWWYDEEREGAALRGVLAGLDGAAQ
ncbi:hypothetical protein NSI01_06250 [Pimelobacter simplex]|nr:hypothetical protein NSI01_06250 [Pimelobacter simplex]